MAAESKWHMSPTQAGRVGGPWHYDIGADDNENIALVYPAEDGHEVTEQRARLICEARETKRQRDMLLAAAKDVVDADKLGKSVFYARKALERARTTIAECEQGETTT